MQQMPGSRMSPSDEGQQSSTPAAAGDRQTDPVIEVLSVYVETANNYVNWAYDTVLTYIKAAREMKLDSLVSYQMKQYFYINFYPLLIFSSLVGGAIGIAIFYVFIKDFDKKKPVTVGVQPTKEEEEKAGEIDDGEVPGETYTPHALLRGEFNLANVAERHGYKFVKHRGANVTKMNEEEQELMESSSVSSVEDEMLVEEIDSDCEVENEATDDDMPELEQNAPRASREKNSDTPTYTKPTKKKLSDAELVGKLGTLHGKLATARLRQESLRMEREMSQAQREEEKRLRAEQLEGILAMMMKDKEKFGIDTREQLNEQMSLYNF